MSDTETVEKDEAEAAEAVAESTSPALTTSTFRFDYLYRNQFDITKAAVGIIHDLSAATGTPIRYWSVDDEDADSVGLDEHPYDMYAESSYSAGCLLISVDEPMEPDAVLLNNIREAVLKAFAKAEPQSVMTNGIGDMYWDGDDDGSSYDWQAVDRPNSVFIETGQKLVLLGDGKKVRFIFEVESQSQGNKADWTGLRDVISSRFRQAFPDVSYDLSKRYTHATHISHEELYTLQIDLQLTEEPDPMVVAKFWEICLTAINEQQMVYPKYIHFLSNAVGKMRIAGADWTYIDPPAALLLG